MSSINSVRKLQILYFSKKNKKIKNLKNGEKKWPDISIYTYYSFCNVYLRNISVKQSSKTSGSVCSRAIRKYL